MTNGCFECAQECIDIFVKVVKAKSTQRDEVIMGYVDEYGVVHGRQFCLNPEVCGCSGECEEAGAVTCVEDVRVRNLRSWEEFLCTSRVRIHLCFDIVVIYRALCSVIPVNGSRGSNNVAGAEERFCLETFRDIEYTREITLDEFCPPLTPEQFLNEVDQSEICVRNIRYEVELGARCSGINSDPTDPNRDECIPNPEGPGTCAEITVFADVTDKLAKMEDILVCGRRDCDC